MSVVSHTSPTADYIQILNRITNTRASFIQIKMPTADDMNHEKEKKNQESGGLPLPVPLNAPKCLGDEALEGGGSAREARSRVWIGRGSGEWIGGWKTKKWRWKQQRWLGARSEEAVRGCGPHGSWGWMTRGAHVLARSGRVVDDSVSSSSSPNSVRTCRWCLTFLLLDEKSKYSFITFIFFMIDVFVRKKK